MYNIINISFSVETDTRLNIAQSVEISNRTIELMPELAKWLKQQLFLEFPYGKYEVTIDQ